METKKKQVFIGYLKETDCEIAKKICQTLESSGISCWYAERDHTRGMYDTATEKAIKNCKIFLPVLTEDSKDSQQLNKEFRTALNRYLNSEPVEIECLYMDDVDMGGTAFERIYDLFPKINGSSSGNDSIDNKTVMSVFDRCKTVLNEMEEEDRQKTAGATPGEDVGKEKDEEKRRERVREELKDKAEKKRREEEEELEKNGEAGQENAAAEPEKNGDAGQEKVGEGLREEGVAGRGEAKKEPPSSEQKPPSSSMNRGVIAPLSAVFFSGTFLAFYNAFVDTLDLLFGNSLFESHPKIGRTILFLISVIAAIVVTLLVLRLIKKLWNFLKAKKLLPDRKRLKFVLKCTAAVAALAIVIAVSVHLLNNLDIAGTPGQGPEPPDPSTFSPEEITYQEAQRLASYGNQAQRLKAAMLWGSLGDYEDSRKLSFDIWDQYRANRTISAGFSHAVAVRHDGSAAFAGVSGERERSQLLSWGELLEISAGGRHTVGLFADGTAVAAGNNTYGQCNVTGELWRNLKSVSAGYTCSAGLKQDGSVVLTGLLGIMRFSADSPPLTGWTDIVAVSAGGNRIVGLRSDGTVLFFGEPLPPPPPDYKFEEEWQDLIAVSAGMNHIVGLRRDGTVLATGKNDSGQLDVRGEEWKDIVDIAAGDYHTLGLRKDGTVVAAGGNARDGSCDVSEWKNIVSLAAGRRQSIGLFSNGGTVYAGPADVPSFDRVRQDMKGEEWQNIRVN